MNIKYMGQMDSKGKNRCAIINYKDKEEAIAEDLITVLEDMGYHVDAFDEGTDIKWLMVSVCDKTEYKELLEEYKEFKKISKMFNSAIDK